MKVTFLFTGINVDIPTNHLIPRVPQRINYILWLEDLLNQSKNAIGIDIGKEKLILVRKISVSCLKGVALVQFMEL